MAADLSLVEVNSQTAPKTWPLLLAAVETADFIAVDLELSGLGRGVTVTRGSTVDERYKTLCEVAKNYAILAMGVACFQWQPGDTNGIGCKVEVFNILLLSQQSFTIDPSSAKFLINHGFDFNRLFKFGLSYNPAGLYATMSSRSASEEFSIQALFVHLLLHGCPLVVHNGLLDLVFLYHSCYSTLPPSLNVFAADLSEMFERGGVYDTKAITECHLGERISYLEYIFRKSQYRSSFAEGHGGHYLELSFTQYPSDVPVEGVSVAPPPLPSLDELLEIKLCDTYVNHGFCRHGNCEKSHNVLVAIAQEEHRIELLKVKRKRKREQRAAHCKKLKGDGESGRGKEEESEECDDDSNAAAADQLVDIFQQELASARARLSPHQTPSQHQQEEKPNKSASFGHRAGFDAFMTGYAFASFLISSSKKGVSTASSFSHTLEKSGLKEMKNCVANRKKNNLPVRLVKSHFVKTSQDHRHLQDRLRELHTQSNTHGN